MTGCWQAAGWPAGWQLASSGPAEWLTGFSLAGWLFAFLDGDYLLNSRSMVKVADPAGTMFASASAK